MLRLILTAALVLAVAGCATQPVGNAEATLVGAANILDPGLVQPRAGSVPVTIKRDSGASAGACSTRIFVNGKPVADIRTSEKVIVYLPEGDNMFGARANGICAGGLVEARLTLRSGAAQALRVGYGSNGEFFLVPTAF
jgi:hypothetical protein